MYGDGPEFHFDYYNSFVIQPMMVDVLRAVSPADSTWDFMIPSVEKRLSRYARVQESMIHGDGTWPLVGRSICYRTGAFHALSCAALWDLLPKEISPAQVRCALTATIRRVLLDDANYDSKGWLKIGLQGHQPGLGERYISTGSLYLASFVFPALGLSSNSTLWSAPDEPWTQPRLWQEGLDQPCDHAEKEAPRLI